MQVLTPYLRSSLQNLNVQKKNMSFVLPLFIETDDQKF